jgi:DNA-binding NarL/FixJ family response regulator
VKDLEPESDYRVLIADDHPLYRSALRGLVVDAFDAVQVEECEDIASALALLSAGDIDIVLLDLSLPDAHRLEGLERLREANPATPVIVCSAQDDPQLVRDAFRLGVSGYLPKSSGAAVTRHALQLIRGGGVYVPSEVLLDNALGTGAEESAIGSGQGPELPVSSDCRAGLTPRQQAVLSLLERGMSNKSIARELDIGEITVKAHVSAILRKLGVDNRVQAVVAARQLR